jgi:phage gp45-like
MWLTEKINSDSTKKVFALGTVISAGENEIVSCDTELRDPVKVHPYGYFCSLPQGENILCVDSAVVGSVETAGERSKAVAPGEILILSAGGAYIRLCNDGTVVINGKIFAGEAGE